MWVSSNVCWSVFFLACLFSRTAADVPLSVWYLTFYCNPRIQLAVVNKIIMQGLNATAVSYGNYIENYLYSEQVYDGEAGPDQDLVNSKNKQTIRSYNVSNIFNVILYQTLYILLTPVIAVREIFKAVKVSVIRDFCR